MVFTRRTADLAAVALIPPGIAATGFALSDSPAQPEGALDHRTPRGKVPAEVARRAELYGRRAVLALAGTLGEGAHEVPGVDACHGVLPAPTPLAEAPARGAELLTGATERALRVIVPGTRLPGPASAGLRPGALGGPAQADVSGTQRPSTVR
ncbi:hypothetical protein ACVW19_001694 [Streptomyces sp. TE5632]